MQFRDLPKQYEVLKPQIDEAMNSVVASVSQTMELVTSAMDKGVAAISSMNAIVGGMNGAVQLLTASIENAINMKIAQMMSKIVGAINTAHGITHPMFLSIFQMTWTENG